MAGGCRRGKQRHGPSQGPLAAQPPRSVPRLPPAAARPQHRPAEPGSAPLSPAASSRGAAFLPLALRPLGSRPRGSPRAPRLRAMLPGQISPARDAEGLPNTAARAGPAPRRGEAWPHPFSVGQAPPPGGSSAQLRRAQTNRPSSLLPERGVIALPVLRSRSRSRALARAGKGRRV